MQITIVQSEIETAIRNYIGEQINVKEGMQIDIVLRATRGDEGTTAVIDITPMKADNSAAKQTSLQAVKKESKAETINTGVASTSVAVKREDTAKEVLTDPDPSTGGTVQTAGDQAAQGTAEQVGGQVATEGAAQAEQPADDAPKAPTRSLFAGMKKPVNG